MFAGGAGKALVVGAAATILAVSGCASSTPQGAARVQVLAARSLSQVFEALAAEFESAQASRIRVDLSFAGTPALVAQIDAGAPAGVFASADEANMNRVIAAGQASGARVFALNRFAVVYRAGNPFEIDRLGDLADPGLSVVICAPVVPCGEYTRAALKSAGTEIRPVSEEDNVGSVLTRVGLGEADAGIVYVTDLKAALGEPGSGVAGFALEPGEGGEIVARYPIAVLESAADPAAARSFVSFVLSGAGREILARFGFELP